MAPARLLIVIGCALLALSAWTLQQSPPAAALDLCPWIGQIAHDCPAWASDLRLPEYAPWGLYLLAGIGFLSVIGPLLTGSTSRPPENMLAQFIQRGRDLHERCRKEGDEAVLADVHDWSDEVARFLRRLGHRYVIAFADLGGIQLFASQYDTVTTLEIRRRIQRLTEFAERLRAGEITPEPRH